MRRSVSRMVRQTRSSSTMRTVAPRSSSGSGSSGLGGLKGTVARSIGREMAIEAEPTAPGVGKAALRRSLIRALSSCATEADFVQVLYAELHPEFGYDVIL